MAVSSQSNSQTEEEEIAIVQCVVAVVYLLSYISRPSQLIEGAAHAETCSACRSTQGASLSAVVELITTVAQLQRCVAV